MDIYNAVQKSNNAQNNEEELMSVETKEKFKLASIVSIAALVFSIIGTVAANSFIAGSYAEKVTATEIKTRVIEQELDKHITHAEESYVKKEVFDESVKRRDEIFKLILDKLDRIEDKLDRR